MQIYSEHEMNTLFDENPYEQADEYQSSIHKASKNESPKIVKNASGENGQSERHLKISGDEMSKSQQLSDR